MRYIPVAIVATLLLASCHTPRQASATPTEPAKVDVFGCIESQVPRPEWLACSAVIDFESDDLSIKVSANIRYRRDSVLWMNVSKMGFEVARVLVTKDSVYVLNQMDKSCTVRGLDYIKTTLGLPAEFKNLENLLLGAPVWLTETGNMQTQKDAIGGWDIRSDGGKTDRSATYQTDPTCRLITMKFKKYGAKDDFYEQLSGFGALANYPNFSYTRNIEVLTEKNGRIGIGLTFSNPEVNVPKAIRFEIPSHFKRG